MDSGFEVLAFWLTLDSGFGYLSDSTQGLGRLRSL